MACLLKERASDSPGIIVFTHNEVLQGVPATSRAVKQRLAENVRAGRWLYGVHIQGDCSWLKSWPVESWHSFVMWPDLSAPFLANLPRERLLGLNCVNFMPDPGPRPIGMERNVDICIISRPSEIKRIRETLLILHGMMQNNPNFTATLVVPDPRHIALGTRCYRVQGIDQSYFELPLQLFSSQELKRLSFLSTSEQAFGRFPVSQSVMRDLIFRSRFLMLPSHREGTPRVIGEAFLSGTPCILSRSLVTGIHKELNSNNTLLIDDDVATAVQQIREGLSNYSRFRVDVQKARDAFGEVRHKPEFQSWLSQRISADGNRVEGRWFLDELHMRLASHGRRANVQFMEDEDRLVKWLLQVDSLKDHDGIPIDAHDDDAIFGVENVSQFESPNLLTKPISTALRGATRRIRRIIAALRDGTAFNRFS